MNIKSICECLTFGVDPEPYEYTHPIRPYKTSHIALRQVIDKHEFTCEKAQLIRDAIIAEQSLDGPYACD